MKYITDKSQICNYDTGYWDFLDTFDFFDYFDIPEEKRMLGDYTYYGYLLYRGGRAVAEEFLTQWNITSAYVMHFKGTSELQWRSPFKRTCYHRELKKSHTYLDKYNLSKYRKIILLENFDEIVEFITAMGCYPTFARYDEFYLFCNNNIFLMIGHNNDICVFQRCDSCWKPGSAQLDLLYYQ